MATNHKLNGCVKKTVNILFLIAPILLAGCQNSSKPPSLVTDSASASLSVSTPLASPELESAAPATANAEASEGTASVCQKELLALSKVNQNQYAQKRAAFDELLKSASVYTTVRDDIGSQTRDTMDALYKYKTQKLCSDIEQAVRQSLINRGESFK